MTAKSSAAGITRRRHDSDSSTRKSIRSRTVNDGHPNSCQATLAEIRHFEAIERPRRSHVGSRRCAVGARPVRVQFIRCAYRRPCERPLPSDRSLRGRLAFFAGWVARARCVQGPACVGSEVGSDRTWATRSVSKRAPPFRSLRGRLALFAGWVARARCVQGPACVGSEVTSDRLSDSVCGARARRGSVRARSRRTRNLSSVARGFRRSGSSDVGSDR